MGMHGVAADHTQGIVCLSGMGMQASGIQAKLVTGNKGRMLLIGRLSLRSTGLSSAVMTCAQTQLAACTHLQR